MARIAIHIKTHGSRHIVPEDIEYALVDTGIAPYAATWGQEVVDIIEQDTETITVDLYDREVVAQALADALAAQLMASCPGSSVEAEAIDGWPPRGWQYANFPIRY